ncbi:MAG: ABC transporter permease [Spirochaeta sp.]|nr:ABC transporter permease [Spirochaeta sp.]
MRLACEKTTALGAIIGLGALSMPFLLMKENRVALGEPYLYHSLPQGPHVLLPLTLLVLSLAAAFLPQRSAVRAGKIVLGQLYLAVMLTALSLAGAVLVAPEAFGRVSPSSGFWLAILAAYILIQGSLKNAQVRYSLRVLIGVLPLIFAGGLFLAGLLDSLAVVMEFANRQARFMSELTTHLYISLTAVGLATLVGVPLGVLAWKRRHLEKPVFGGVNGLQTIPSLALFGLMIAPLAYLSRQFPVLRELGVRGIGNAPALIAITLYALLPITRNAYTGLAAIETGVIDSGRGMGMTRTELMRYVEVPIALPIILSGVRVSTVQAIGNTAVAALIGAGGLGAFVFQGLGQGAPDLIVMGVLPIIALSVFMDRGFAVLIAVLTPPGQKDVHSD